MSTSGFNLWQGKSKSRLSPRLLLCPFLISFFVCWAPHLYIKSAAFQPQVCCLCIQGNQLVKQTRRQSQMVDMVWPLYWKKMSISKYISPEWVTNVLLFHPESFVCLREDELTHLIGFIKEKPVTVTRVALSAFLWLFNGSCLGCCCKFIALISTGGSYF